MQTKRQSAAENIALLLHDLIKQIENAKLIFFNREVESYESEKYCNLFGLCKYNY